MKRILDNIISSKIFRGLILGFIFFFLFSIGSRRHFTGIVDLTYRSDVFSVFFMLSVTVFISFIIGLSKMDKKKVFSAILAGIISGLTVIALTFFLIEPMRKAEGISGGTLPFTLLLFSPIILTVITINIIERSFIRLVTSIVGLLLTTILSIILITLGNLLSYGWWGSGMPNSRWGVWPFYIACSISGILMLFGIEMGDFFKRRYMTKNESK